MPPSRLTEQEYSKHKWAVVDKFRYMLDHHGEFPEKYKTRKFSQRVLKEKWGNAETKAIPGFCEDITGRLEQHDGKSFAFLRNPQGDVFVPPDLAKKVGSDEGAVRTVRAIFRKTKNGKVGWKALKFSR